MKYHQIIFLTTGLKCKFAEDSWSPVSEKAGPEQCICKHEFISVFDSSLDRPEVLCREGEYCWANGVCYPECFDLPIANNQTCKCNDDWCWKRPGVDIYCNPDTGCYIPELCPQNYTVFTESPMCSCNKELIFTNSSYCVNNETFALPTQECPLPPEL